MELCVSLFFTLQHAGELIDLDVVSLSVKILKHVSGVMYM